ncbi:MAG: sugar ABC transporter permease [Clostridia bacterium]|nr:sugar ABC transporter permease [Clostridia bacterium]
MNGVTNKKSSRRVRERNNLIFYCLMLAFPIAQFCIFYIFVNFNAILLAFQKYNPDGTLTFGTLDNFRRLFADMKGLQQLRDGWGNSLLVYVISILSSPIGIIFSYYIYKKRFASNFFKVVLFAPSVISSVVIVTMFQMMADSFIPNLINEWFHPQPQMLGLLTMEETIFPTIIFYGIWIGQGTSILMYLGAMGNINDSVIEAAQIDGITPMKEFLFVVFPQIFPTFSVFFVSSLTTLLTNQMNLYTFYGANAKPQYNTIGYYMYVKLIRSSGIADYPYVAALGLLITVITLPVVLIARWAMNKINPMEAK